MEGCKCSLPYLFRRSNTDLNFSICKKPRGKILAQSRSYYIAYNENYERSNVERLGDSFLRELLRVAGTNVEELGSILKSKSEFTDEELREIQVALQRSSNTIRTIRENAASKF
jgi:hypothetical protein